MIYLIYLNAFEDRYGDDAEQDGEVRLQLTRQQVPGREVNIFDYTTHFCQANVWNKSGMLYKHGQFGQCHYI